MWIKNKFSLLLTSKSKNYLLAFVLIEILFALSYPGNRTEADDGFWFAADVRDKSFVELFNPRFPFYLPFVRVFFRLTTALGFDFDVYSLLCVISAVFSGFSILLFYRLLSKYFKVTRKWSMLAVLLMLFSYEYWRYSMEAEVYMMAIYGLLLSVRQYLIVQRTNHIVDWIWLIAITCLAVLFYKPNFVPIFLCFPILILSKRRFKEFSLYYMACGILLLGTFFLIYSFADVSADNFVEYITKGTKRSSGSALMVVVVVASNFVSVQWLFSFENIQSLIQGKMPHKAIEEEFFMADALGNEKYLLIVLSAISIIIACILAFRVIKTISRKYLHDFKPIIFIIAWALVYGSFLAVFDPTSNEPWLMVQMPLIIITIFILKQGPPLQYYLFFSLVVLVFLINLLGGMAPLEDEKGDLNYVKTNWLAENTDENDYILSYGPISLIRYLDYHTEATVINLEEKIEDGLQVLKDPQMKKENIFFTHDFTSPSKAISFRSKEPIQLMNEFVNKRSLLLDTMNVTNGIYTFRLANDVHTNKE